MTFDVKVTAPSSLTFQPAGPGCERHWQGHITVPIQVVDTPDQAVDPIVDPKFDEAVRTAIAISIGPNQATPPKSAMWINVSRPASIEPFLKTSSCRALVEVLDGARVIDSLEVDVRQAPPPGASSCYYRDVLGKKLGDPEFLKRLRIRISTTPEIALHDLRRSKYWAGRIDAPLAEFLDRK
jgi:hypothetical protein